MAKDGRLALPFACAFVGTLVAALLVPAARAGTPDEDTDQAIANNLAVQIALQRGREFMVNGKYKAAIDVLEAQVARINGDREFLRVLRDAYRSHIQELRLAKRDAEVATYTRRMEIIDPQAKTDHPKATIIAVKPLPEETPKTDRVVRAEKEDDPFRDGNIRKRTAQELVDQAEKEYAVKRFDVALNAYEEAFQVDPAALTECKERWAYCKLSQVFFQLKNSSAAEPAPPDWEKEVRKAMSLASANKQFLLFANDLLGQIDDRRSGRPSGKDSGKEVAVRHLAKTPEGWQIAESTNFRIVHNQSRELAEDVARAAERTRIEMQKKWFGEAGDTWKPVCEIHLYLTAQEYAKSTHESESSPGHSTLYCEGTRVTSRQIHLHCDDPNMLTAVLPHETTHVVLAGQFGNKPLPRWADEGMAVLTEPREKIDRYLVRLPDFERQHQLFTVRQLLQQEEWPEARLISAFYAQSVSVVGFLTEKGGPASFTRFVRDGRRVGYEKALQQIYGYKDFNELEQDWRKVALSERTKPGAGVAERRP
jgi:tetratricopeptide (TPR) repeat protein